MNYINICGGIGNQMFQYAFACYIKEFTSTNFKLIVDSYDHDIKRAYCLQSAFNIKHDLVVKNEVKDILKYAWPYFIRRLLSKKIFNKIRPSNMIYEDSFDLLRCNNIKNAYYHGYWQNFNFVNKVEIQLRKIFEFSAPVLTSAPKYIYELTTGNSVAVHVRRGDYLALNNSNQNITLSGDYYIKSFKYLSEILSDPKFYIFTDDPLWVKENLLGCFKDCILVEYHEKFPDYFDMYLMSKASHNIIANSTFSWWAAWLNDNPNKIVIAPQNWLIKGITPFIPTNWVTL